MHPLNTVAAGLPTRGGGAQGGLLWLVGVSEILVTGAADGDCTGGCITVGGIEMLPRRPTTASRSRTGSRSTPHRST